jgi:hypothetical protein
MKKYNLGEKNEGQEKEGIAKGRREITREKRRKSYNKLIK